MNLSNIRIGNGYDVHRLVEDRKLILGGVDIPHFMGLDGHSDADALAHALCDALLGALGVGDIGAYFPETDPKWKGIAEWGAGSGWRFGLADLFGARFWSRHRPENIEELV